MEFHFKINEGEAHFITMTVVEQLQNKHYILFNKTNALKL